MNLITLYLILIQEVSDLFGCDLPVEGAEAGVFAWKSGPFLQGLCEGHWIILDEVHTMLFFNVISIKKIVCTLIYH